MTKRRRIILEALVLTPGLLLTQLVDPYYRYFAIFALGLVTYFFSAFCLREDLKKIGWLMALPLPALYAIAVSLFYFLLPELFITRLVILILFGFGMYAVLLIENIFSIASERTIQLLHAAQAVGFLMTLIIAFLFYDTIFSFRLPALVNSVLVFIISLILILQSLWTVVLTETVEKRLIFYSLGISWLVAQLAFVISFWPLAIVAVSLFLVSTCYVLLGIVQNYLTGRLFKNTLMEYLRVGVIVLIIIYFLAQWD